MKTVMWELGKKNAAKKVYRKWLQTPPADMAGLAW